MILVGFYTYRHVRGSPKRKDPHPFFGADFDIPLFEPRLERKQPSLDVAQTQIVPEPQGKDSKHDIGPISKPPGTEDLHELSVQLPDDLSELLFGEDGIQDLRVEIRESGRLIAGDKPVALDPDDPGGRVERGC